MKRKAAAGSALVIDEDIIDKCDSEDQFDRFDNLFRSVISVPKDAVSQKEQELRQAKAQRKSEARK